MAEFTLPLTAEGAVTAPTGVFELTVPTAESVTYHESGEINVLEIDDFGWAITDGVNPMRFAVNGAIYNAGGLAPGSAPTMVPLGAVRATEIGTWTGVPADGETITIGGIVITFKNTLITDGTGPSYQVKRDATAGGDINYLNVRKMFDHGRVSPGPDGQSFLEGTQGVEYFINGLGVPNQRVSPYDAFGLEVSAIDTSANTITYRYSIYGSEGNSIITSEAASNYTHDGGTPSTMTGGTDGTGPGPGAGTYRYFYTWFRSVDGAETGISPKNSITQTANTDIAVTVTASADTTFDFVNVYRTTTKGVEFYLVKSTPVATLTFNDNVIDEDLANQVPFNELNYRLYSEGMGPRGRALALFKDTLYTVGGHTAAEYSKGTVDVTQTFTSVTFSLQGVTELMVGRTLIVDGTSEEYRILSVDESAATAEIDRKYEGATDVAATFKIKDLYDTSKIRAAVTFKPNQWPSEFSPGRVDTDDPQGGTALLATANRLFVFSRTSIVAMTGEEAESWTLDPIGKNVGCVAPSMLVPVEGGGVFLSPDGLYTISPGGMLNHISSPKTEEYTRAQGIDGTIARIAWANIDQGYMEFDSKDRIVIAGVPLDGAVTPNYEIILDLQNGVWALYKRGEWTTTAQADTAIGSQALLAGDRHGWLWHANIGESDGFYGAEAVATLSGAQTVRVLTAAGTPFTTDEGGKPVIVLYADGETVAYGKVASSTTSALRLYEDLDAAPAAGDQIVLGGIGWQIKTGFPTFGEEYREKTLRSVTIRHAPTTRGEYFLSFAVDGGSLQLCPVGTSIGDLSQANGKTKHKVQWPGDSHAIKLRGFKPGGRAIIRGGVFDLVVRENARM